VAQTPSARSAAILKKNHLLLGRSASAMRASARGTLARNTASLRCCLALMDTGQRTQGASRGGGHWPEGGVVAVRWGCRPLTSSLRGHLRSALRPGMSKELNSVYCQELPIQPRIRTQDALCQQIKRDRCSERSFWRDLQYSKEVIKWTLVSAVRRSCARAGLVRTASSRIAPYGHRRHFSGE